MKKAGPFYSEVAKQLAAEVRNANNQHGELQIGGKTVLAVVRLTSAHPISNIQSVVHAFVVLGDTVGHLGVSPLCLCR